MKEETKLILHLLGMMVIITLVLFLIRRATEPFNNKLCRDTGLYLKMDRAFDNPLNGHMASGKPIYGAYFVDCK